MVHPVATASDRSVPLAYVGALVAELADTRRPPLEKFDTILPREAEAFDLAYSYLSRIDPEADCEEFEIIGTTARKPTPSGVGGSAFA